MSFFSCLFIASYKSLLEDYAAQGTSGPLPETHWEDLIGHTLGEEQQTPVLPKAKDKVRIKCACICPFLHIYFAL